MASEQKTSEKAAAAPPPGEANMKRSIAMKLFATDTQKAEVALAFTKTKDDLSTWQVPVGQIVGRIFAVNTRTWEDKSGDIQTSKYATGEFEAVVYGSGEVIESPNADLPSYFLEGIEGALARNGNEAVLIGIEIVLTATGKSIPYAYEVRNLVPREADSPLNRLKAAIAKQGKLRLPPPAEGAGGPIDPPEGASA